MPRQGTAEALVRSRELLEGRSSKAAHGAALLFALVPFSFLPLFEERGPLASQLEGSSFFGQTYPPM